MTSTGIKCFVCAGQGRGRVWKDRDPIEGYKLAPSHTCLFCDGAGVIAPSDPRASAVLAYLDALQKDKAAREEERERREAVRIRLVAAARAKLTADELEALGVRKDD